MSSRAPTTKSELARHLVSRLEALPTRKLSDADAEALYALAYNQYNRASYADALASFRILVAFRPADPTYLLGSALCFQRMGRYSEAIGGYSMLSLVEPENPSHQLACAECQLLANRRDDAARTLEGVIAQCAETGTHEAVRARAQAMLELLRSKNEQHASA